MVPEGEPPASDPAASDPPATDPPANDPPGGDPAGGGGGGGDDLEGRVKDIVRDALAELFPSGGPPAGGGGPASIEADMEARVRAAVATLRKDEERDSVIAQLKEKVLVEKAPVKQRWIERVMWGVRGDD